MLVSISVELSESKLCDILRLVCEHKCLCVEKLTYELFIIYYELF